VRDGVETVRYVKVMSLYQYVCKYFKFPVGHPVIHVGDPCLDRESTLGKESLIKCCVLPPKNFYHPVLIFRCNDRLLFCLFKQNNAGSECAYEKVAERTLTGT